VPQESNQNGVRALMRLHNTLCVILFATILLCPAVATAADSCEGLTAITLPDTTITSAQSIAAGEFASPAGATEGFRDLPAFCRVTATLKPSADSDIRVEVWMPASGWNGNFYFSHRNQRRSVDSIGFRRAIEDTCGHSRTAFLAFLAPKRHQC
jgi:hypothetical protein